MASLFPTDVQGVPSALPVSIRIVFTARSTMVCLIARLKILDVAEMSTTSHPFGLRFMSGSWLTNLQTSANFSNVLKTQYPFVVDLTVLVMFWLGAE